MIKLKSTTMLDKLFEEAKLEGMGPKILFEVKFILVKFVKFTNTPIGSEPERQYEGSAKHTTLKFFGSQSIPDHLLKHGSFGPAEELNSHFTEFRGQHQFGPSNSL